MAVRRRFVPSFQSIAARVAVALCLLGSAAPARAAPVCTPGTRAAVQRTFQTALDTLRVREDLPGAVAAFSGPGCPFVEAATGYADLEQAVPMTPRSRLMSGSIGKSFVAALALKIAREGRLSLDDRAESWLGDEPWFDRLPNAHEVTIRMLLNHGSGIPDYPYTLAFLRKILVRRFFGDHAAPFPPAELIGIVLDRDSLFPPGRGYAYTDTEYLLVGLILERATGRAYEDLLRERLLRPLGLTRTEPADGLAFEGLASGYHWRLSPLPSKVSEGGVYRFHPGTEWTGGGLVTNARDLVRWARALYEGRVLGAADTEQIVAEPNPFDGEMAYAYGLGVFLYETPLGRARGHSGWTPGYTASMLYFPHARTAVAFMTNTDRAGDPRDHLLALAKTILPPSSPPARHSGEADPPGAHRHARRCSGQAGLCPATP